MGQRANQTVLALFALLLLPVAAFATANDPAGEPGRRIVLPPAASANWTLADFDGDRQPDLARSRSIAHRGNHLYEMSLELSAGRRVISFTFRNSNDLELEVSAVDLDGDNDLDLVVRGRYFGERIGAWINDGWGSFSENPSNLYPSYFERTVLSALVSDCVNPAAENKEPRSLNAPKALGFSLPAPPVFESVISESLDCDRRAQSGPLHLRAPPIG